MKKIISMLLAFALFLSCVPFVALAEVPHITEPPPVEALQENTADDPVLYCPKCNSMGIKIDQWVEYNYYYTSFWYTLECPNPDCHKYQWNTMYFQVENMHDEGMEEDANALSPDITTN